MATTVVLCTTPKIARGPRLNYFPVRTSSQHPIDRLDCNPMNDVITHHTVTTLSLHLPLDHPSPIITPITLLER
jgi:hypothetical protein